MTYTIYSKQYFTPTTGATVTIANADFDIRVILNPAGTLATLTVAMPSSPKDGQRVEVASSQIVTALTMSVGTINGALTTLGVNGFGAWVYDATAIKWFRVV
jgi:hypothetical protein